MANRYLGVPDKEELMITGTGLSPQGSRSPSPDGSSLSDSGTETSEDYTVLDGVKEMNEMLLKQIQAIRRQIEISEKTYNDEKAKLLATKEAELQQKDNEISNLKTSLHSKDDDILQLKRVGAEKDRLIQDKGVEVDNLKIMIEQIQEKAQKIHKKVKRAQRKTPARTEADNISESPRNEEMEQLRSEVGELKIRIATLEEELAKAVEVIEEQNQQMRTMGEDKNYEEAKLAEKLNNMTDSMRRDVERACQVLLRNTEDMLELKQQSKVIYKELGSLKNQIKVLIQRGDIRAPDNTEDLAVETACENPPSKEQVFPNAVTQAEFLPQIQRDFKSTPKLQRGNSQLFTLSVQNKPQTFRQARLHTHYTGPEQATRQVYQSDDSITRKVDRFQNLTTKSLSVQTIQSPVGDSINRRSIIPPIAARIKQGNPPISARGGVKRDPKK